jgi:hypothetical protein
MTRRKVPRALLGLLVVIMLGLSFLVYAGTRALCEILSVGPALQQWVPFTAWLVAITLMGTALGVLVEKRS